MYTDKERRELVKCMKSVRKDGTSWREVANLFGYIDAQSVQCAYRYHRNHVGIQNGKVGRPKKQEVAE